MKRTTNPSNDVVDQLLRKQFSAPGDQLEPSSGFTHSVMEAIQAQAAAPPPIAFPWRRAVPGMLAALCGLVAMIVLVLRTGNSGGTATPALSLNGQFTASLLRDFVANTGLLSPGVAASGWILVAACLSVAAIAASFRLTGRSD